MRRCVPVCHVRVRVRHPERDMRHVCPRVHALTPALARTPRMTAHAPLTPTLVCARAQAIFSNSREVEPVLVQKAVMAMMRLCQRLLPYKPDIAESLIKGKRIGRIVYNLYKSVCMCIGRKHIAPRRCAAARWHYARARAQPKRECAARW